MLELRCGVRSRFQLWFDGVQEEELQADSEQDCSRTMLTWSHYSFRMLLKAKVAETGTGIVVVTEEYTSKTCTACGSVHQKLGSTKVFSCLSCGFTTGRDVNGARNILLKSMHELGLHVSSTSDGEQKVALGPAPSC